jgi:hypothetical protein
MRVRGILGLYLFIIKLFINYLNYLIIIKDNFEYSQENDSNIMGTRKKCNSCLLYITNVIYEFNMNSLEQKLRTFFGSATKFFLFRF